MAFLKIDKALGEYYVVLGKADYYDVNKKGKFFKYCEHNGFEEDDIDEEFANEPADCMYIEFDEEFPLNPPINDTEAQCTEIFRIIKYCYKYGKPPITTSCDEKEQESMNIYSHKKATKNIFDIKIKSNKATQIECDKLYKEQCPLLYKNEDVLRRCFAIWIQNNNYPFLINLVDSYLRDKALYKYEENKDLSMVKWRKKSKYFRKISKKQLEMAEILASGVETYLRRGCPSWHYGPAKILRIQDSMRDITLYILAFNKFINSLLKQNSSITPFQMDIAIAVRRVKPLEMMQNACDDAFDDSEDDSADSVDEEQYNIDIIGDIEERLNVNKLPFYSFEMKQDLNGTALVLRNITHAFNTFKNDKLSHKHYPQQRRFCVFVDRRGFSKVNHHKLTMFEPPSSCSEIPHHHVPEWYLNASKTCIIPTVNVNDNKSTICADSQVNGQLISLIIHSHYFHSFDFGYKMTRDRKEIETIRNQITERKTNDTIEHDATVSGINTIIQNKKNQLQRQDIQGLAMNNKWIKNEANVDDEYSYGCRYFYWKDYKDVITDRNQNKYDEKTSVFTKLCDGNVAVSTNLSGRGTGISTDRGMQIFAEILEEHEKRTEIAEIMKQIDMCDPQKLKGQCITFNNTFLKFLREYYNGPLVLNIDKKYKKAWSKEMDNFLRFLHSTGTSAKTKWEYEIPQGKLQNLLGKLSNKDKPSELLAFAAMNRMINAWTCMVAYISFPSYIDEDIVNRSGGFDNERQPELGMSIRNLILDSVGHVCDTAKYLGGMFRYELKENADIIFEYMLIKEFGTTDSKKNAIIKLLQRTLRGYKLEIPKAISLKNCCSHILHSQSRIRESLIIAQQLINLKPVDIKGNAKDLWRFIEKGIIVLLNSCIKMVNIAATYFSYFMKFKSVFEHYSSAFSKGIEAGLGLHCVKWKWFDYCLYSAIKKLNKKETGLYQVYTDLDKKQIECGYHPTGSPRGYDYLEMPVYLKGLLEEHPSAAYYVYRFFSDVFYTRHAMINLDALLKVFPALNAIVITQLQRITDFINSTPWDKIPVLNTLNKEDTITLSMSKANFICSLHNSIQGSMNDMELIPIGNQRSIWIVRIFDNIDIGISLRMNDTDGMNVTGIHLRREDIQQQFKIPQQQYYRLDNFKSHIDELVIMDPSEIGDVFALNDLYDSYSESDESESVYDYTDWETNDEDESDQEWDEKIDESVFRFKQ